MYKIKVFTILILFVLIIAACGPAATEEKPVEEAVAEEEVAQPTDMPAETPKTQLRLAHSWPARIDPAVGGDFIALTFHPNIYDSLVFPNVDGTVGPWLAESWDVSSDTLSYTFHLKKGVLFHDGSELMASDVVYSMNRLLTVGQGMAYLFTNHVQSIEAIDDYTVTITIDKPYALFDLSLVRLSIVNEDLVKANTEAEGQYGENGDYGTGWLLTHDAGSGPYQVKDVQLEEYVLLEKNNDWWASDQFVANSPDEVRFIPVPQAATLRTLMANQELEISDQWQSADTIRAVDEIEGVEIAAYDAVT
ncbi:MAG: ABC transporter substrate-binding protein, partial [Anaerolineaceae bacterium]|nr:ABC transporter substrate-binding protein [Anaerolineaceae bacterium]